MRAFYIVSGDLLPYRIGRKRDPAAHVRKALLRGNKRQSLPIPAQNAWTKYNSVF